MSASDFSLVGTRVALVGLGRMGSAILPHLIAAKLDVVVWNRTSEKMRDAARSGARMAASLHEVVTSADIILSILFDDQALNDVYLGPSGLLTAGCAGKLYIDMSTVLPDTARRIGKKAAARRAAFVNAPVSGSVLPAKQGKLLVLAGASSKDFERAKPILALFARKIEHVGPVGAGSAMKLAIQLPISVYWQSLAEALCLASEAGLSLDQMLRLIADSPAALPALQSKIPTILKSDEDVSFDITSAVKDLMIMNQVARGLKVSLPAADTTLAAYQAAAENGFASQDIANIVNFTMEKFYKR